MSNKLDAVLDESGRNFQWDIASRGKGGRVIEILSEHTCQGMLQGYTLTGRTGLFPSYEAFLGIVHTMMVQYSKFTKMVGCILSVLVCTDESGCRQTKSRGGSTSGR